MAPQEWNRDRNVQQNYVQFLPGTATCGALFLDPTPKWRGSGAVKVIVGCYLIHT